MKRVNVNMYPRDGYFFVETDGATIRGSSWDNVVKRVIAYRSRDKRPISNVEEEVHAQACKNNPGLCYDDSGAAMQVPRKEERRITVKGAVLKWFLNIRERLASKDIRYVSPDEANARASICAKCPKNFGYPSGCSSCETAVKESRKAILGARKPKGGLDACGVLGEDTATSVYLDEHRVLNSDLPDNCWRKAQ